MKGLLLFVALILLVLLFVNTGDTMLEAFSTSESADAAVVFREMDDNARSAGRFSRYFSEMTDYFHKQIPSPSTKVIFADADKVAAIPNFDSALQDALEVTLSISPPEKEHGRTVRRVQVSDIQARFNACKSVMRPDTMISGGDCGWLFIPDSADTANPSLCLLGSPTGPNPDIRIGGEPIQLTNGYQWFWNTPEAKAAAVVAETAKECKRIRACNAIDPAVRCTLDETLACGFDSQSGHGVPYSVNVAGSGNNLIKRPSACNTPMFCATATIPADKRRCVLQLLDYEGIDRNGWLRLNVSETVATDFERALNAVHERAKTPQTLQISRAELTGATKISLDFRAKIGYLKRLTGSHDSFLADFAQMTVYGKLLDGRAFDVANYFLTAARQGSSTGDVCKGEVEVNSEVNSKVENQASCQTRLAGSILQQEWRKAGCQPAGSDYPGAGSITSMKSLSDYRGEYTKLYNTMFEVEVPSRQRDAIRKCLNRTYTTDTIIESQDFCNERGIEYFVYEGLNAEKTLIGHLYSYQGLLVDPKSDPTIAYEQSYNLRESLESANTSVHVSYVARTMVKVPKLPTEAATNSSSSIVLAPDTLWVDRNGYTILVDRAVLQSQNIPLQRDKRHMLEIVYSSDNKTRSWDRSKYPYIDLNLDLFQLFQSKKKPILSFNFYKRSYFDFNAIAALETTNNLKIVEMGDEFGMAWNIPTPQQSLKLVPRIRADLLQVISQRLYIPTNLTDASEYVLYSLKDSEVYSETCTLNGRGLRYTVQNRFETRKYEFPVSSFGELYMGTWVNIAMKFVRSNGSLGVSLYINEEMYGSVQTKDITNEVFLRPLAVFVMDTTFSGIMGWFHVYDLQKLENGRIEGFQSSSVLSQETAFDPSRTDTRPLKDRIARKVSDFMVDLVPNFKKDIFSGVPLSGSLSGSPSGSLSGSPSGSPSVSEISSCPFDGIASGSLTSANYTSQLMYNTKFSKEVKDSFGKEATNENKTGFKSVKECDDVCNVNCVAYTYDSVGNKCILYSSLGDTQKTETEPGHVSVVKNTSSSNVDLEKQKILTERSINAYKTLKKELITNNIFYDLFKERGSFDRGTNTIIPRLNDPRSDKEIEEDLAKVKAGVYTIECLRGIYKKYAM